MLRYLMPELAELSADERDIVLKQRCVQVLAGFTHPICAVNVQNRHLRLCALARPGVAPAATMAVHIGQIQALNNALTMWTSPMVGGLSDRIGRRNLQVFMKLAWMCFHSFNGLYGYSSLRNHMLLEALTWGILCPGSGWQVFSAAHRRKPPFWAVKCPARP
jgi:hypothetical protein